MKLTFDQYQQLARSTAVYPYIGTNIMYPTLGLCGEAGEVAEKVKKLYRDHNGELTTDYIALIEQELGDVLWYMAAIANELGITLDGIANTNLRKLADRKHRMTLHGDGDDR